MQRKDLLELKRRFKKESCTISRMAGCYVNSQKEKVVTLNELFPNLPEDEFYKYLEIAKKTLSGTLGNNLLELSFLAPGRDETPQPGASKRQFFGGMLSSKLQQEELLERFYDLIIEHYDYTGNYLILLYYDDYDVMVKTEDGRRLDESEEVYTYVLCSLCPVTLSKPGLGYLEEENKIGVRLRDWIVGAPENGFLYPAFTDRSSDVDALVFYTKNAKESHPSFMENGLGCTPMRTGMQQKKAFENVVKKAVAGTQLESEEVFLTLQESLCDMVDRQELENPKDPQPVPLTAQTFAQMVAECEIDEYIAPKISAAFAEEFSDAVPTADAILDAKLLAKNEQKKKEKELVSEVATLKEALSKVQTNQYEADNTPSDNVEDMDAPDTQDAKDLCDVFLRVSPDRASRITSQIINGQRCLLIPVEEGDDIDINGMKLD